MKKKPAFPRRLIALRILVTVGYCVVGGWLLWPLIVKGWPLASFAWVTVMLALLVTIGTRGFGIPPAGLLRLLTTSSKGLESTVRGLRRSGVAETLSTIEDVLAIPLFAGSIVFSALTKQPIQHHVLMVCLAVLIGTSQWVKSRLRQALENMQTDAKPVDGGSTRQRNEESSGELE